MITIALLVPSRGRPGMLRDMWTSAQLTAAEPSRVHLYVALDDDDPTRDDVIERFRTERAVISLGPRRVLSEYWNDLAELAMRAGPRPGREAADILWHGNDDVRFVEPGWDTHLVEDFDAFPPDRIGLVYGRDGIHNAGMATLGFYSREWVQALGGRLVPPYFVSDWNDTWNDFVARQIGRAQHDPRIVTEHLHYVVQKSPYDQTHREREARGAAANVNALYASPEMEAKRRADVATLRAAIEAAR